MTKEARSNLFPSGEPALSNEVVLTADMQVSSEV